jgi:ATP-dependent Clp protease, protease subunit
MLYTINTNLPVNKEEFKKLMPAPTFLRVTKFDEDSYKDFSIQACNALASGQPILPIIIDSYGGYIYSLLGKLEIIKNAKVPVLTLCQTKAMSCGAVLLAAGTKGTRFASPDASILVHQAASGDWGKLTDIKNSVQQTEALNELLLNKLDSYCGKKSGFWKKYLKDNENKDLYFTAAEAKKLGLIDHIRTPEIELNVKAEFKLK